MPTIERSPIAVVRTPITYLTDNNILRSGGWYVWARPEEDPPSWKIKKNERILWCPWCGEWAIYKKVHGDDAWRCQSYCGWANTNEYYVRHINKIWFEDVPLGELKNLDIPKPNRRR